MLNSSRIAIIGMGPMALMLAHYAKRHFSNITLFGKPIGLNEHMAGRAAGGMLAPAYECFGEYDDSFTEFALKSRFIWNDIANEYGFALDENGLALASSEAMLQRLDVIFETGKKFGIDINPCQIPDGINAKAGLRLGCDALLDPIEVLSKIGNSLKASNIEFRFDEINSIEENSIITNQEVQKFDLIIIAAGYNSIDFAGKFPILNNLLPFRGQTLLISHPPNFAGSIRNETTYLMARGNHTAVGATSYEAADWQIHDAEIAQLHKMAIDLMPQLSNGQIIANFAGIRPQTKDGAPILGEIANNVWFAGGAYRNGWLLAPLMAKRLIENICENKSFESFLDVKRFNS